MKYWYSDSREPKDLDIIDKNSPKSTKETEYYWTDAFQYILDNNKDSAYVDPNFLITIKMSHLAWDINWDKHMKDYLFLKSKGLEVNEELFKLLYKDWENIHGKKSVKMNVPNKGFFKDNIKREIEHDKLHEYFMFYDRPLNERIRQDLSKPYCSEYMWDKLSEEGKFKCAIEEIFVLTYERNSSIKSVPHAITKTIKQMITSTTSGWFNIYLIENFENLRKEYHSHYRERVNLIKSQRKE
jgi:hypothetical protein